MAAEGLVQGALRRPLILHVLYRFATGGLENGVVNLINGLPQYSHAVLALDDCDAAFCARVHQPGTEFIALRKPPGQSLKMAPRFLAQLRRLQPDLVHTRNLAALEMQLPAWWGRTRARLHSEHGWDVDDLGGQSRRRIWQRRVCSPFVQHYVALSGDLQRYLVDRVGIAAQRVTRICNGVDTERFRPAKPCRDAIDGSPFNDPELLVIGSVGRMQTVKGHADLLEAFIQLCAQQPQLGDRLRLVIVGDGPHRQACLQGLAQAGLASQAWLPGDRADVPALMRHFSVFALPSWAEGISNTVLEAMASGLPVLATAVGGNGELVRPAQTGALVEPRQPAALAAVLAQWLQDPRQLAAMRLASRKRAEQEFSLPRMLSRYAAVYDRLLGR